MLTKKIQYTNFNDEEVEETVMFHLSTPELIRLDTQYQGGLEALLDRLIANKNPKGIMELFEKILSMGYGEKSQDGRSFVKDEARTKAFMESPAYDELFMELLSDEKVASAFFTALVPKTKAAINDIGQKNNVSRN